MFIAASLITTLEQLAPASRLLVAYSGGVDSHVLLHALASLRPQLGPGLAAVHINHGLSPLASTWSDHCRFVCSALDVEYIVAEIDATPFGDESPEEAARRARYAAFDSILTREDVLLTAHQQDDQAETMFLQLIRGAGPRGLASMPTVAPFGVARIARPLLDWSREELQLYAQAHELKWVEDPSNTDSRFDRNFLRNEILTRIKQRWPSASRTIARSARLCAEAAELLDELGALDKNPIDTERSERISKTLRAATRRRLAKMMEPASAIIAQSMALSRLQTLSASRQRNLLRLWFNELGLPTPHERHIEHVVEMIYMAEDANPLVTWPGVEVRRYRGMLFASVPLPAVDESLQMEWDLQAQLNIPGVGALYTRPAVGHGFRPTALTSSVTVRMRQGGEQIRPARRRETHTLKHLFQDAGVPPWLRDRIPLIYVDDELVCVAGYWTADAWSVRPGEQSTAIEFKPAW